MTQYTIQSGDTLSSIAASLPANVTWKTLWGHNGRILVKEQQRRGIERPTPHAIFPGTVIET